MVDAETKRIVQITPEGEVVLLHEGEPLLHPTGIDYADFGSLYAVTDRDLSNELGRVYFYNKEEQTFEMLLEDYGDYRDLISCVPYNLLAFPLAPLGEEDGARIVFVPYSDPEGIPGHDIGAGGQSLDQYMGISMDYNGDFWFADQGIAEPDGVLVRFSDEVRGMLLRNLPFPEDTVQIPPPQYPCRSLS